MSVISSNFAKNFTANKKLAENLAQKLRKIKLGGSEKAITKFIAQNKLLPRDRITKLCDKNSDFLELSPLAADGVYADYTPCAGIITGIGKVHGINCMIICNDATVKGGAYYPLTVKKHLRAQQIALENKLPCIYLVDSAGANLSFQAEVFPDKDHFGRIFFNQARMSAQNIPQIAVVMGSCTAGGAYVPAMADHCVMVKNQATIFLAGPPLVQAATGEIVDSETLGGAETHCKISGVADYYADNDYHAIDITRKIISYSSLLQTPKETHKDIKQPKHDISELYSIIPENLSTNFNPKEIIKRIVDDSDFLEFKENFGKTIITGFAKINNYKVGIIANNGILFSDSALKATHFIQLCCQQKIPLLFLQNISGFMVGKKVEHEGIAKHGAKMVNAVACANVPKLTIITGGSFGAGNYGMCGRAYDPRFLWAWPNSKISVMGGKQAASVFSQINKNNNQQDLSNVIEKYNTESDCYYASARLWDDGIIDPADTRKVLSHALEIVYQNEFADSNFGVFRM